MTTLRHSTIAPWDPPSGSNAENSNAALRPVENVSIIDVINKALGYDVMLAAGAERFAAEDEWLAEWDMGAQYDTLEPYDDS